MTGERFDDVRHYSRSFDVYTYADEDDGPVYRVVASFENESDARTFMEARAHEHAPVDLYLRPPSEQVRVVCEYLAQVHAR